MRKKMKILIVVYVIITIGFINWAVYEIFPDLKYQLSKSEKQYLADNIDKLVFVGDEGFPPFSFKVDDKYFGYEADIVRHIMDKTGIEVDYQLMNWKDALKALDSGKADVITGMKVTEGRKEKYLFTNPFITSTQSIITPKKIENIRLEDLKKYRVIVQENSITHDMAIQNDVKDILLVKKPLEGMQLLASGSGEVWLENNMIALYYLRLNNIDSHFYVHTLDETRGNYAMAINKTNPQLLSILNKILFRLSKNGTFDLLDNKWFGMVGHRPYSKTSVWNYIILFSYFSITGVFLIYLWNKSIHYQLAIRTKDLKEANEQILFERKKIQKLLEGISNSFATAIDYRDSYTGNHSRRVASICMAIGKEMNLSERELLELHLGALLHDVGKVGIPDEILKKEGPLTTEEYNFIKQHPEIGTRILEVLPEYDAIKNAVYYHHERWDGKKEGSFSAYPGMLKGEDIPLIARIISVADSFDAMTTDRPYRKALDYSEAVKRIKEGSGNQYDSSVVVCFLKIFDQRQVDLR